MRDRQNKYARAVQADNGLEMLLNLQEWLADYRRLNQSVVLEDTRTIRREMHCRSLGASVITREA